MNEKEVEIDWEPQERQLLCLNSAGLSEPFEKNLYLRPSGSVGEPFHPAIADILGYGGSAGGGKTDTLLAIGMVAGLQYPRLNIGYFRREFPQLEGVGGAIIRSQELFRSIGAYNDQKHRWKFLNESLLQFCHCKNAKDVYNYQSWQFDILLIDECTQFTSEMIDYLITRNRATVSYSTFKPFTALATNPGNIGHVFFKDRFVNLGEPVKTHDYRYETGQVRKHIFIPSKLEDNKILTKRDPNYADRLSTNEKNKRMLLEGDWNVTTGQYFDEWRSYLHTCRPFTPRHDLVKFGGMDWGREKPFAFLAGALERVEYNERKFHRLWIYHEEYGTHKGADEWGKIIKRNVNLEEFEIVEADPSMFKKKDDNETRSLADDMRDQWGDNFDKLHPANNNRIQGWNVVHDWLRIAPDGKPYLRIAESCENLIRTLPELLHDDHNVEDLNTDSEDHAADALRYLLMHVVWIDASLGLTASQKALAGVPRQPNLETAMDLSEFESVKEEKSTLTPRSQSTSQ